LAFAAATAGAAVAGVATAATGVVANAAAEKAPTIKEAINLFIQNFLLGFGTAPTSE
jgi:hypothetical protein